VLETFSKWGHKILRKKLSIWTIIAIVTFAITNQSGFALAEENSTVESQISAAVPSLLDQTAASAEIEIKHDSNAHTATVTDVVGTSDNSSVSIGIATDGQPLVHDGELSVINSESGNYSQVIQPLSSGYRIINIMNSQTSDNEFNFLINGPDGFKLEEHEGAVWVVLGEEILGQIRAPWATDSNGRDVETHFVISGHTLTQIVLPAADDAFPIVSDPNWGYLYTYQLDIPFSTAWTRIHACFNCFFPVIGAPKSFPSFYQLLPLKVNMLGFPLNFECRMGYVLTSTTYDKWEFLATKNHTDGLGSSITFTFQKVNAATSKLVVDAFIVNDFYFGANGAYMDGAKQNWQKFADNLNA
jgi:hypothetical protein